MKRYIQSAAAADEVVGKADRIKDIMDDIVFRGIDDLSDEHVSKLAELVEDMYQIAGVIKQDVLDNYS